MPRPPWWELGGQDAYELLGVSPDATAAQIAQAYREQMRIWHTDTSGLMSAEEMSRRLNCARTVLRDHRAAYDDYRLAPANAEADDDTGDGAGAPGAGHGDEPAEEVPDDPWDPVSDPWQGADVGAHAPPSSAAPPHHGSPYARPPFPPPSDVTPGAVHGAVPFRPGPPLRHRLPRRAKLLLAFVLGLYAVGFAGCAASVIVSSSSQDAGSEPSATVGKPFAGSWKGRMEDTDSGKAVWDIELVLKQGRHDGQVRYVKGRCRGTAVPIRSAKNRLTLRTDFPALQNGCDVGEIELTYGKGGRLDAAVHDREHQDRITARGGLMKR